MPRLFADDGEKVGGTEKFHQVDLRNVVDIVFPERLDVPLAVSVVNESLAVAGDLGKRLRGQHIWIAGQHLGI
ncbi:MAG TPA: hypothetical protein IAD07_03070 [Candidatus Fimivicinus intestinavium]|nr:hypothetical protein [Candidatus Fimivicinus intestinavium]